MTINHLPVHRSSMEQKLLLWTKMVARIGQKSCGTLVQKTHSELQLIKMRISRYLLLQISYTGLYNNKTHFSHHAVYTGASIIRSQHISHPKIQFSMRPPRHGPRSSTAGGVGIGGTWGTCPTTILWFDNTIPDHFLRRG